MSKHKKRTKISEEYSSSKKTKCSQIPLKKKSINEGTSSELHRIEKTSYPVWKFEQFVDTGKFGLSVIIQYKDQAYTVFNQLKGLEGLTWQEIEQQTHDNGKSRNHPVTIDDLTKDGKDAYKEKYPRDELYPGEIFSLGLNNLIRIIGYRRGNAFYAEWLDFKHEFVLRK